MTVIHNSHTCALDNGGPCVMCKFANERENQTCVCNGGLDPDCVVHQTEYDAQQRKIYDTGTDSETTLHTLTESVVAEVARELSEACKHGTMGYCFACVRERHNEDMLDGRFDDDVFPLEHPPLRSLAEAQAYREGYAAGWTDAHAARLQAENEALREDLVEMGRLATIRKGSI